VRNEDVCEFTATMTWGTRVVQETSVVPVGASGGHLPAMEKGLRASKRPSKHGKLERSTRKGAMPKRDEEIGGVEPPQDQCCPFWPWCCAGGSNKVANWPW
jgi:hypothetical protein